MDSWLHDSHATALLGSAMLDPSQPYIYPPISIHLHLPPAFSSERPGRDAHYYLYDVKTMHLISVFISQCKYKSS